MSKTITSEWSESYVHCIYCQKGAPFDYIQIDFGDQNLDFLNVKNSAYSYLGFTLRMQRFLKNNRLLVCTLHKYI